MPGVVVKTGVVDSVRNFPVFGSGEHRFVAHGHDAFNARTFANESHHQHAGKTTFQVAGAFGAGGGLRRVAFNGDPWRFIRQTVLVVQGARDPNSVAFANAKGTLPTGSNVEVVEHRVVQGVVAFADGQRRFLALAPRLPRAHVVRHALFGVGGHERFDFLGASQQCGFNVVDEFFIKRNTIVALATPLVEHLIHGFRPLHPAVDFVQTVPFWLVIAGGLSLV